MISFICLAKYALSHSVSRLTRLPLIALILSLIGATSSNANSLVAIKPQSWESVLTTLNIKPDNNEQIFFTQPTTENLTELNESELNEITKKWVVQSKETKQSRKALTFDRNIFFHKEIEKLNNQQINLLSQNSLRHKTSINYKEQATLSLQSVMKNSVTSTAALLSSPNIDQIGFCFGRALLVHYSLLKLNVPQKDLTKVFAIGELSVSNVLWRFHVAVMVRDEKEKFLVVDPLLNSVTPYNEWIKKIQSYDIKFPYSRLRFYFTPPDKFLPAFGTYDLAQINSPSLKPFFDKLLKTL